MCMLFFLFNKLKSKYFFLRNIFLMFYIYMYFYESVYVFKLKVIIVKKMYFNCKIF